MPANINGQDLIPIYIKTDTDLVKPFGKLPRAKAFALSAAIRKQFRAHGVDDSLPGHDGAIFHSPQVTKRSLSIVVKFIKGHKRGDKKGLTLEHVSTRNFIEVVQVFATSEAFEISPKNRGDELHDAIINRLERAPVSKAQFEVVHKSLGTDHQVFKIMTHELIKASNTASPPPELEAIQEYCKETGLYTKIGTAENRYLNWLKRTAQQSSTP